MLAGLFYGFFALLDSNKVKAGHLAQKVSYDVLRYQWVVAEAYDIEHNRDISREYQAVAYQFLSSGGFVEFEDKVIRNTGSWQVKQDRLRIQFDDATLAEGQSFDMQLLRPEEMLLQNEQRRFRLLRLTL
ncbi:hypothetical protein ADICEAN_02425 [Cesiribacter andamanensis AMV16]|uniref:Uncharacterized protein n=1 Tax=Cesiribacter andamanensis AMV16 TaxID=1279009 RepID=M7NVE5_9BACT|nr:hypothetical protein ADICEAN_02425 [Cesiribacter andamanensis AMV16]